jgi:hypothetical protein
MFGITSRKLEELFVCEQFGDARQGVPRTIRLVHAPLKV